MVALRRGVTLYLLVFFCIFVLLGPYFIRNISWLFSERAITGLIESRFDFVLIYTVLLSSFAILLFFPMGRGKWQKCNLAYVAFIIALFTEMFGFPLTVYMLSSVAPLPPADFEPAVALTVDVPGLQFRLLTTSLVAGTITILSFLLIASGWKEIYRSRNANRLVKTGIYSYIRHPQYTGIIIVITAWLFAWPTLPTIIMWPVLTFVYYRLSRREEAAMLEKFGREYDEYKSSVPMFLPGWNW